MTDVSTLEKTRDALADEWNRWSPGNDREIAAFYRNSECLAADLAAWHQTTERQGWSQAIAQIVGANDVATVLDVGAGGGHDLRALQAAFPDRFPRWQGLYAVEPNHTLAGDLVENGITVATAIEFAEGEYDLVICIDVLEHVPDPTAFLQAVTARVKPGGLLIEASATHDQSTPLHLPSLSGWMPDERLAEAGFVAVEQIGRLAVWQRNELVDKASVLLVSHREIAAPTVECLFKLYDFGWPISLPYGDALIDRGRAKAVSQWFKYDATDVFLMIDDDIVFREEDAARVVAIAREKRSIACGAYPVGDGGHLACRGFPGERIDFGPNEAPRVIRWPATGFMAVHRDVIAALVKTMEPCYPEAADSFWPMFQPYAFEGNYLSEDYAFGQRAKELGFDTWLDPKSILIHLKIKGISVLNMPGATVTQ